MPLVLGIVFGAVLIARETDNGTHVLAWTQTVTRRRWVLTKVCAALAATVVCAALVSVLVTWWSRTPNALYQNRFDPLKFDSQNLMPVGFAVFALGLGVAAGAVLRRSLPAVAVTVGGFLAVRLPIEIYLRPHYQSPAATLTAVTAQTAAPPGAWVLNGTLLRPNGQAIHGAFDPESVCPGALDRRAAADCLNRLGYHYKTTFQPAGRYWHFQWTEAILFIAIGLALLAAAVAVTLRRDA